MTVYQHYDRLINTEGQEEENRRYGAEGREMERRECEEES